MPPNRVQSIHIYNLLLRKNPSCSWRTHHTRHIYVFLMNTNSSFECSHHADMSSSSEHYEPFKSYEAYGWEFNFIPKGTSKKRSPSDFYCCILNQELWRATVPHAQFIRGWRTAQYMIHLRPIFSVQNSLYISLRAASTYGLLMAYEKSAHRHIEAIVSPSVYHRKIYI